MFIGISWLIGAIIVIFLVGFVVGANVAENLARGLPRRFINDPSQIEDYRELSQCGDLVLVRMKGQRGWILMQGQVSREGEGIRIVPPNTPLLRARN